MFCRAVFLSTEQFYNFAFASSLKSKQSQQKRNLADIQESLNYS